MVKKNLYFLLTIFGLVLNFPLQAQLKLTGQLNGLKADSLTFIYTINGKTHQDRVPTNLGSFTWYAQIDSPQMINVKLPLEGGYLDYPFFSEQGQMKFLGSLENLDSILQIKITGSPTQTLFHSYLSERLTLIKKMNMLNGRMAREVDSADILNLQVLHTEKMISTGLPEKYIKENPESYVSLYLLNQLMDGKLDYASANVLFQGLSQPIRFSSGGIITGKNLAILKLSALGRTLKPFSIPDLNGKRVTIADYKGKILLIDFWASWCGPCRQENPNLLKNFKKYHSRGFDILGISCDTDTFKWKKAVKEDQLPWKQVRDLEILKNYGLRSIPSSFLVDGNGKILGLNLRGIDLEQKLDKIFESKK